MKLMLFLIIVYQCNNLSSEVISEEENSQINNSNNNKLSSESQLTSSSLDNPHSIVSYVADDGELGTVGDNGVVFQFRRSIKSDNTEIEARRRSALDKNFMRFGRSDKNFMRFGRPDESFESLEDDMEKRRDKNLLRFGKKDARNMMRFGRSDDKRRDKNLLRFGRSRDNDRNKLRFGRSDKNFMRFGRDPTKRLISQDKNLIRFGRNDPSLIEEVNDYNDANDYDDFVDIPAERQPTPEKYDEYGKKILRLGKRRSQNLMRFGRGNGNFMRFGRANGNFMRFGRSPIKTNLICVDDNCVLEEKDNQISQIVQNRKLGDGNNQEIIKYEKVTSTSTNDEKASKDLSDLFGANMDEPLLRPETNDYDKNK